MTHQKIEELANEVAKDVAQHFAGFAVESFEVRGGAISILFSWQGSFRTKVILCLKEKDTDESIREEIRRQLHGESQEQYGA